MPRLWQELQEIAPERDRRGSKNSFLPSSTLAGSLITAASIGWIGSCRGAPDAWPAHSAMTTPAASIACFFLMAFSC